MEIGVSLPQVGPHVSPEGIVKLAQAAEGHGFAAVWTIDRLLRPQPSGTAAPGRVASDVPARLSTVYDPIEALSWAAAHTERVRLGTSVLDALFYPPVVLARRLATLDRLSKGRVVAGLGQGWMPEEFATAGVSLRHRGTRFEDFIGALRAAWGKDPVEHQGPFYEIPRSEIGPKPVQTGGPPVVIGAQAPAAIARAARLADGFNPIAVSWEMLQESIDLFTAHAGELGRDPRRLLIILRANGPVSLEPMRERPMLGGSPEQIAEDIPLVRELGVDHLFFDLNTASATVDDQIELLGPLIALRNA